MKAFEKVISEKDFDDIVLSELKFAQIDFRSNTMESQPSQPHCSYEGHLLNWTLRRLFNYWFATSKKDKIDLGVAELLKKTWEKEIVASLSYDGISICYQINTPRALIAFKRAVLFSEALDKKWDGSFAFEIGSGFGDNCFGNGNDYYR